VTAAAPALAVPRRAGLHLSRRTWAGVVFIGFGLLDIVGFGLAARKGDARFLLVLPSSAVHLSPLNLPAGPTGIVAGVLSIAIGVVWLLLDLGRLAKRLAISGVLILFVLSFLAWSDAGKSLSLVGLLQNTVERSIPLVLGALAGVLCERSGVINIAIEGQLLLGAFAAAIVTSASGSLWLGVVAGAAAGGLLGLILAVFSIRYLVDQIVVGVVLNVLATGLTGYLYDRVMIPYQNTLNAPSTFQPIRIPGLSRIPILGPVLFEGTVFLYMTYVLVILIQVGLFRTRWGLRVRAVGEHPVAAETVGIRVLFTRYRNVVLGGLVAGIGGAYLTIGSVGPFGKNISSGKGFIALAAMIFGRWTPIGAVGAALLFGFTDAVQNILSVLGTSIPSDFLLMAPYIATIVVVAGVVGKVRPPKADGKPYIKT
jgi:simple sugar transport system permease protein